MDERAESLAGEAGASESDSSAIGASVLSFAPPVGSSLRRRAYFAAPGGMAKLRVSPSMSVSCVKD